MPVMFYPQEDELGSSTLDQKLEVLLEAAQRYRAAILDVHKSVEVISSDKKRMTPRDITHAYNWEEITKVLRQIRDLPEANAGAKSLKATKLKKLAEIYEVLRGAKMAKLEAVRICLINEAKQVSSTGSL